MKVLFQIATLSSMLIVSGSALAQQASDGEPFGRGVVKPATPATIDDSVLDGVQEQVPGRDGLSDGVPGPSNLDDTIHSNLADDEAGPIRGHGKNDAPGQN